MRRDVNIALQFGQWLGGYHEPVAVAVANQPAFHGFDPSGRRSRLSLESPVPVFISHERFRIGLLPDGCPPAGMEAAVFSILTTNYFSGNQL